MLRTFKIGIIFIISGFALLIISVALGEGGFALFFIFPVFYTYGPIGAAGIFLVILGIMIMFFAPFFHIAAAHDFETYEYKNPYAEIPPDEEYYGDKNKKKEVSYGGLILIGPIPIIFGSDKRAAMYAIVTGFLMLIALVLLLLLA